MWSAPPEDRAFWNPSGSNRQLFLYPAPYPMETQARPRIGLRTGRRLPWTAKRGRTIWFSIGLVARALSLVIAPPGLRSHAVISNRAWLSGLHDRTVGHRACFKNDCNDLAFIPQGLNPPISGPFPARLKSCPDTKQ